MLERQRQALSKAVNSVSLAEEIGLPTAVDSAALVYRIDLRDDAWNRAIDIDRDGTEDFADGWLAIVSGAGAYAIESVGPEADALML